MNRQGRCQRGRDAHCPRPMGSHWPDGQLKPRWAGEHQQRPRLWRAPRSHPMTRLGRRVLRDVAFPAETGNRRIRAGHALPDVRTAACRHDAGPAKREGLQLACRRGTRMLPLPPSHTHAGRALASTSTTPSAGHLPRDRHLLGNPQRWAAAHEQSGTYRAR
jgi:hypothetical protein